MTEIGMALSNPLHGARRPGTVGQPLPREYWQRAEATRDPFWDGWLRAGDIAVVERADRVAGWR